MIKVTIFYPNKEGSWFDLNYYLNKHMPWAIERLGSALKGVSVEQGVSGAQPGTEPAYMVMCNYTFESTEAFLGAFLPHAEVLQGDRLNYTNSEPIIQFSEIKLSQF